MKGSSSDVVLWVVLMRMINGRILGLIPTMSSRRQVSMALNADTVSLVIIQGFSCLLVHGSAEVHLQGGRYKPQSNRGGETGRLGTVRLSAVK